MSEDYQKALKSLNVSFSELSGIGRIGTMFFQLNNREKARKIFEGLIELDNSNADAYAALGATLLSLGREQDAFENLIKSLELNPKQIAPYVNLAEICIRRHELVEAVSFLKQAIDLDPNQTHPAANRARVMAYGIKQIIRMDI